MKTAHLVGDSPTIRRTWKLIQQVAQTDVRVLVTGESGTGKEVVARLIHCNSLRASRPFVAINCAALTEGVVESELFGHEKGAFTGAQFARPGCFEQAHTGTLLLDEVTEIRPHIQAKLLRVLQESRVRRVGGSTDREVDARVIAASNRNARHAVSSDVLREDLYYRLRVIEIEMPPLRERKEDIPALVMHFLCVFARKVRPNLHHVGPAALALMMAYDWPGNVRELENVIMRAVVLASPDDRELLPHHLPSELTGDPAPELEIVPPTSSLDLNSAMRRLRKFYAEEALRRTKGSKVEAARMLGISRRALYDIL
jgi:transcriptional regulator with PAS, ATPase and Fis domain